MCLRDSETWPLRFVHRPPTMLISAAQHSPYIGSPPRPRPTIPSLDPSEDRPPAGRATEGGVPLDPGRPGSRRARTGDTLDSNGHDRTLVVLVRRSQEDRRSSSLEESFLRT